ncbi:hypothetical protein [Lonepinella koalarum]|uniref:Uncharacterized protein n=1 Tax=Lonepinella koalarum TaxID=53417 RepID=A0A4R1KJF1_9PAST|nr:hypothetical protein [Lonepinella koalarum]TCK64938.1 hypothetical protein EV692_2423 [Lonepinella koalarum]
MSKPLPPETKWLKSVVAQGLARLIVLGLPGRPAEEMAKQVATVWVEALLFKFSGWDEKLDRKRLEKAFMQLCCDCDKFPSPKLLLDCLPPRDIVCLPSPKSEPLSPERQAELAQRFQELRQFLGQASQTRRITP